MRTTPRILDQISVEKTKVGEQLARLDADRATVTAQLTDLEIAERVPVRVSNMVERKGAVLTEGRFVQSPAAARVKTTSLTSG